MTSKLWIKTKNKMPLSGKRVPFVYKYDDGETYLAFGYWTRTFSDKGMANPIYWVDETESCTLIFENKDVIYWMEIPDWE